MTFTEDLHTRKKMMQDRNTRACADWMETRTTDNINGNFEKWKIVCDKKRDCMRLGVHYLDKVGTFWVRFPDLLLPVWDIFKI